MASRQQHPAELRERAVAMVCELRAESGNPRGSIARVGERLGLNPGTLRNWVEQAEFDGGRRPGPATGDKPAGQAGSTVRAPAIWVPLTSFVGRATDVDALAALIDGSRLVTVIGAGGVGKTRLASEVARRVGAQFPDGVWFVGLGTIADGAQVPIEVMAALGVQQVRGRSQLEVLAETLAPRRLLLVLDNCEHVLPAVADLGKALLTRSDEVRILATSRESLGVGGERRYRLSPLELPSPGPHEAAGQSEAETLFIERARQANPRFSTTAEDARLVARLVTRLDGIPLAIELAAARVEALGMPVLADRIDALRLLDGRDRLATARHRSLAAVADWSYQLLSEPERRVFRQLTVFPGPFTLEAAEAVSGADAVPMVLRLVDCSLLAPPRSGADQRLRYTMLETLKTYGLMRLREAGEEREAMAALAGFARAVAGQAAAGLGTADGELEAARWLDAEDATMSRALTWALAHAPQDAVRLATSLAPWWWLRGRLAEAHERLTAAAAPFSCDSEAWVTAQLWLGHLAAFSVDPADAIERYTAVLDAYEKRRPSHTLLEALVVASIVRSDLGDLPGAAQAAHRAVALAGDLGGGAAELFALTARTVSAYREDDDAEALDCARRAEGLLQLDIPGYQIRWCRYILSATLTAVGELDSARRICTPGIAHARQVNDQTTLVALLGVLAGVEHLAGDITRAQEYLREAVVVASRIGMTLRLAGLIVQSGHLAAATGHWAEAVTLWAAYTADRKRRGEPAGSVYRGRRSAYRRQLEQALSPDQQRDAEERGFMMTVAAAAEYIIMLIDSDQRESSQSAPASPLSPRERELVTLVAQGHTNAAIAARLSISERTVSSHLDRIRDKTGLRRRADLTRLALADGLV